MEDTIVAYHYSNPIAFQSMRNGRTYRKVGLIPIQRFIRLGNENGLPGEAYEGIINGLLEPEPKSWTENPEFSNLWRYLMSDICRKEEEVMLLSFQLKPEDKAYVVERAHIERELYKESKGHGESTKETINKACREYWESRVPVFEYSGSYSVPQLAIWSGIEFERLKVEWIKPSEELWERVINNHW
ncbi:MAG: hypothetical protein KJ955_03255 [Nanoarchaeota archaeon]|nr:hypothetical protein [Nanoarchaeota archaeon]